MTERLTPNVFQMTAGIDALLAKMYGESRGVEHFSTGGLAVHPDYQFKGIGSALHRYIADQASDQGKKLFFFSTETIVS